MSRRELKDLYRLYYDWLVRFLDERDPVGLLTEGNPGREYEPEARKMLRLLAAELSRDELADRVHAIFVEFFTPSSAGDRETYVPIADAMLANWRRMRSDLSQD